MALSRKIKKEVTKYRKFRRASVYIWLKKVAIKPIKIKRDRSYWASNKNWKNLIA